MRSIFSVIFWLCCYLLLVLAPLFVLLLGTRTAGSGFWWDFSMALGFSAMSMMGIQFILTARFRRVTAPFGIDIIYFFHRYVAVLAIALVVIHYLVIQIKYPQALGNLNPLQAPWYMTAGRSALLLFLIIISTSLWRKQLHIHYDEWRLLHIFLAVSAFLLALGHIEGVGHYIEEPFKHVFWTGYIMFWFLLIVYVRLIKPWRIRSRPYRVTEIRQDCTDCWTLVLQPDGHAGMRFKPGQFAWLSLHKSPFLIKEHPFSISSSANCHERIEFTIKELGDFTRSINKTLIGETAYLDGPYGAFTVDRYPDTQGFVFIAGGIGAAPIMSMLRTMADRNEQRPLLLIYGNNCWEDVMFKQELQSLQERLALRIVHVLKNIPNDWVEESGLISPSLIARTLSQDALQYEYFLCGPKAMSDVAQQALHELKVPYCQIHFELFDMV